MAIELVFTGSYKSETSEHTSRIYFNSENEIYMEILNPYNEISFICFDKETAIKFSKELRKQISFIEGEVVNG